MILNGSHIIIKNGRLLHKWDPDALLYLNAAGITSVSQQLAWNRSVIALKSGGLWPKIKAFWPFIGGTSTSHKYNAKNPLQFELTFFGGITHNSSGIKGNGTNGYANTFYNPVTQLDSLSSFSMGVYKSGIEANGATKIYIGSVRLAGPTDATSVGWQNGGTLESGFIGGNTGQYTPLIGNTQTEGLIAINTNSSINAQLWTNGAKDGTTTTQTGAFFNANIFILASNFIGSAANYCNNLIIKSAYITTGLSDTENLLMYNIIQQLQTDLSRQV